MGYKNNNSGVALLYVIMAVLVVSFIGVGLVNITTSDTKASAYYGTSETARLSVYSGFQAAADILSSTDVDNQSLVLGKLNALYTAKTVGRLDSLSDSLWILGSDSTFETIGSDNQQYRVKMEAFDRVNHRATLFVEGVGLGGSRSSARGVYHLSGLTTGFDTVITQNWDGQFALHMAGSAPLWTHGEFNIDGPVYFADPSAVTFDAYFSGSTFHSDFVLGKASGPGTTVRFDASPGKKITFNGPAYFGTRPSLTGGVTFDFNDKVGFEWGVLFDGSPNTFNINATSYWNYDNSAKDWYANIMKGTGSTPLYHDGTFTMSWPKDNIKISGFTENNVGADMSIPDSLGINLKPCDLDIDLSVIDPSLITVWNNPSGTFTEATANALYASSPKWHGFLVLRLDSQMDLGDAGGTFTGKMMLILNGQRLYVGAGGSVFDCDSSANFSIFANGGARVENIGGWDYYRGFMWAGNGSTFIVGGAPPYVKEVHGAIHAANGVTRMDWYPVSGVTSFIKYDATVLEELDKDGFLTTSNCDGIADTTITEDSLLAIIEPSTGITPILQSREY